MLGAHGPTCVPYVPWGWSRSEPVPASSHPHNAGTYARYIPIDLDENNRYAIDAWCERNPGMPRPVIGWGVCRDGFGLQGDVGRRGQGMTEAEAERVAVELNAAIKIGETP
jgi:hypothetical protein